MHAGDEWKALVIFAFAAEQGSPAGQHNLGFTLQRTKSFDMPGRRAAVFLSNRTCITDSFDINKPYKPWGLAACKPWKPAPAHAAWLARLAMKSQNSKICKDLVLTNCRMQLAYEMFLRSGEFLPFGNTDAGLVIWNGLKHKLPEGELQLDLSPHCSRSSSICTYPNHRYQGDS